MKGKKIAFDSQKCIVLERKIKKGSSKPKYYLFNLDTKTYISSLFPTDKESVFYFDYMGNGYHVESNKMTLSQVHSQGILVA